MWIELGSQLISHRVSRRYGRRLEVTQNPEAKIRGVGYGNLQGVQARTPVSSQLTESCREARDVMV